MALLFSCAPKIVYVPVETIRTVIQTVHDTTVNIKLVPYKVQIQTRDTTSHLENPYAISNAMWSDGYLTHSLETKSTPIPVKIQYVTTERHDTTTKTIVQAIPKSDQAKINGYDSLKASNKSKTGTIWKLIGLFSLSVVALFRKPLWLLVQKLIKPI